MHGIRLGGVFPRGARVDGLLPLSPGPAAATPRMPPQDLPPGLAGAPGDSGLGLAPWQWPALAGAPGGSVAAGASALAAAVDPPWRMVRCW